MLQCLMQSLKQRGRGHMHRLATYACLRTCLQLGQAQLRLRMRERVEKMGRHAAQGGVHGGKHGLTGIEEDAE
eukprot:1160720-Pelagomonas_calceolata.AAC.11